MVLYDSARNRSGSHGCVVIPDNTGFDCCMPVNSLVHQLILPSHKCQWGMNPSYMGVGFMDFGWLFIGQPKEKNEVNGKSLWDEVH